TEDTTTSAWQTECAWEREKFDWILEGVCSYPNQTRLLYQHPASFYCDGNPTQLTVECGVNESLYAWINRNGYDIENCFVHWDSTRVWDSTFIEAWHDSNDQNSNGQRDFDAYCGLATKYGVNFIVDTSANWTSNLWQGKGIYTLTGTFIDTAVGNSDDSIYYNVADTSNLLTNAGFETGDSGTFPTGWFDWGGGIKYITTAQYKIGIKSCFIKSGANGLSYIQQIKPSTQNTTYRYSIWIKTSSVNSRITFRKGSEEGSALWSYYVPQDSANNTWRFYTGYFNSGNEDSIRVMIGYETGTTNDSMFVDEIWLYAVKGLLPSWSSIGDYGENIIYYPFIIDSLGIAKHTATAQIESLARAYVTTGGVNQKLMNLNYVPYRYFQKWWSAKLYDIRLVGGFDGSFLDEMWGYTPIPGRYWSKEFGSCDSCWVNRYRTLLAMIKDTLSDKYVITNSGNDTTFISMVDGGLGEGILSPYHPIASNFDSAYYGNPYPYNYYKNQIRYYRIIQGMGKWNLCFSQWNGWEQIHGGTNELVTRYDTAGQLGLKNDYLFESELAGRNRARINSLAYYYLISDDSTMYWYEINYGYLQARYYWADIIEYNIGQPIDSTFQFAFGVDDSGIAYTVLGRKFYGGEGNDTVLVLYKPKSRGNDWWNCYNNPPCSVAMYNISTTDDSDWDKYPATTHSLGGTYVPLRWNGQPDPAIETITLRFDEGAILQRISCK
ncbi:MAG: hypothetical protein ACOZAL_02740, partial [Patescibacteria group bacterium]